MTDENLERVDHVTGDPAATRWRMAARRHQSMWRESQGWTKGTQSLGKNRGTRPIGSRIDTTSGTEGRNFLNDATRRAVNFRLDNPQHLQTLDATRLRTDLLSSMPMCFNLFGPMWADPALASAVSNRWFPDLCPANAEVEVRFEWSPGRADPRWLDDRTAFDAALWIRTGDAVNLIGVETKYHEHPFAEPVIRRRKGVERVREMKKRYREVSARARLFEEPACIDRLWGSDVEQVWRDHLLALACCQQSDELTAAH